MKKLGGFAVVAGMAALWACSMDASAQSGKAVDDRLALMKANGAAVAGITAFYKENKGTMADVEKNLATLQANAAVVGNDSLWPKATSANELGSKATGAKPDIWMKWDDFKEAATSMDVEVRKFAATIKGGDKAAIDAALGTFGRGACGTCHTPFRGKRDT
jgi:cytochrome c556